MDAKKVQPKGKTGKADQALAWIQKLSLIEKQSKDALSDQRYRIRQAQSRLIIDVMGKWLAKSLP